LAVQRHIAGSGTEGPFELITGNWKLTDFFIPSDELVALLRDPSGIGAIIIE
jgi:hypothetical protein